MNTIVSNKVRDVFPYTSAIRRELHANPELSDVEFISSDIIFRELTSFGLAPVRINTGMFVDIEGSAGKRCVGLRADFDALPLTEQTGLAFASKNGCMHACGHDAHTAMLLSVAKLLADNRPKNDVRLIFQFGEEGTGGAAKMIKGGALTGVDEIFALHLSPEIEKGIFGTCAGALFAGVVEFDIDIIGKCSHIAYREEGIDALKAAASFIENFNDAVWSESEVLRVAIGKIVCGSARNIVPGSAHLECTLRCFVDETGDTILSFARELLATIDKELGTESSLSILSEFPPLINHAASVEKFSSVAHTVHQKAGFTGEDFAEYLKLVPGCMAWLGVRDGQHSMPLHSDKFDFDEEVMMCGVGALLALTDE